MLQYAISKIIQGFSNPSYVQVPEVEVPIEPLPTNPLPHDQASGGDGASISWIDKELCGRSVLSSIPSTLSDIPSCSSLSGGTNIMKYMLGNPRPETPVPATISVPFKLPVDTAKMQKSDWVHEYLVHAVEYADGIGVISWIGTGGFIVHDKNKLEEKVLQTMKWKTFKTRLTRNGFKSQREKTTGIYTFTHPKFVKDEIESVRHEFYVGDNDKRTIQRKAKAAKKAQKVKAKKVHRRHAFIGELL